MRAFSHMSSEVKRKSWQTEKVRLLRTTRLFCDCLFFFCWSWPAVQALEAADGTDRELIGPGYGFVFEREWKENTYKQHVQFNTIPINSSPEKPFVITQHQTQNFVVNDVLKYLCRKRATYYNLEPWWRLSAVKEAQKQMSSVKELMTT